MHKAMEILAEPGRSAKLLGIALMAAFLMLALSGCNTPTSAVEEAGSQPAQTQPPVEGGTGEASDGENQTEAQTANIIHRKSTVTQKGTNIRAVVNGQPITNYDVQRRAAFLRLRRVGGDRNARALEELIDQTIKLQAARRANSLASNKEVDDSFARFASSNKMTPSQLNKILSQAGVTSDHFKQFIRGQMSWQRAVSQRFRSETTSSSSKQDALFKIRQSGAAKPETT